MIEPEKRTTATSWKKTAVSWGSVLAVFLFIRFTSPGTIVQGWLQQGLLYTGIFQPDVRYAEDHAEPANFDLKLTSFEGEPLALESLRGKTIFINIWATWCAPCLAEMPFIENLYKDMQEENVAFIMISADDDLEIAKRFVAAKEYSLPMYRFSGHVPDQYNVRTLPTTFVISPSGRMATVHVGMANYDTKGFRNFLKSIIDQPSESVPLQP